ncbi:MAG: helix-turn-helix transcriptional regulator, partial [Anderseniella sp.]|nr:helix-turn-helix transcriptional regulator [Anderseniella sp.]
PMQLTDFPALQLVETPARDPELSGTDILEQFDQAGSAIVIVSVALDILSVSAMAIPLLATQGLAINQSKMLVSTSKASAGAAQRLAQVVADGNTADIELTTPAQVLCIRVIPNLMQCTCILILTQRAVSSKLTVSGFDTLTPQELRVVCRLAEGANVRSIADDLSVKPATIRQYLKQLYCKAGVGSQSELVAWYYCNATVRS